MVYVFEHENNKASYTDDVDLPESYKAKGIAIEQLPVKEKIEGKQAVLKCRKSTGEVWWEYEDMPLTPEEKENTKIAELEQKIQEQNQAIADLTVMISTLQTPQA